MNKSFEIKTGEKQKCRDLICEHAKLKNLNVKTILTLPGRKALCVETFRKQFKKPTIIGLERDSKDFAIIQETQQFQCFNADIRQWSHAQTLKTNHLDIVFLDYFSFLSTSVLGDITDLLTNDNILHPNKPTLLAITLAKSMRGYTDDMLKFMSSILVDGNRRSAENTLEDVATAVASHILDSIPTIGIETLVEKEYKAADKSASMYFLAYLLEK